MSVRYISVVIDWKILHHFATIFQSRLSSHETRKIIPFNLHNSNAFTRTRAHPLRPSPSPIHNQDMRSSTFFYVEREPSNESNYFDENFGTTDLPWLEGVPWNTIYDYLWKIIEGFFLFPFYTENFLTIYMM